MNGGVLLTEAALDAPRLWADFLATLPQDVGASAGFSGVCRGKAANGAALAAMTLECYPAMGTRVFASLRAEAITRWSLTDAWVAHRYGRVVPGETLVVALTAATHRREAFAAAQFLLDMTKTRAPFWKHEETTEGAQWVEARAQDAKAARAWQAS